MKTYKFNHKEMEYLLSAIYVCLVFSLIGVVFGASNVLGQEQSLPYPIYQNENGTLIQNCDCTSVNISSVKDPDGVILVSDVEMIETNNGLWEYNLSSQFTSKLGNYVVTGIGSFDDGTTKVFAYTFEVKKGGLFGLEFDLILLFFLIICVGLYFVGIWLRIPKLMFVCAMIYLILVVVMFANGLNPLITLTLIVFDILAIIGYFKMEGEN